MTLSHQQKIAACVLVLYWPALFVLAHIPIPHVVQEADVSDKSLHFLAYLILTFLIWSTVSGDRKVKWRRAAPWLVLFVIVVYGILDEWLQTYVAGRSCDIRDFFTDLAGSLAGLILSSFLTFWPAVLLVVATFIFGITNVTRANLADLLPVTNAVFHLFAYAILTILWIQCTHLFFAVKAPKAKWLILAIAGPAGFLMIVKLFSVIAGKDFALSDIIISFGSIAAVVTVFYLRALFHKTQGSKSENSGL
ncbi:MAG TPA: VanZ family protein [Sedimentisphaerales bacterium]|nr:VanZ family protein [Sedimentisphaerales bacterium]